MSSPSSPKAEVDLPAGAVQASLAQTGVAATRMILIATILLMLGLLLLVIGRRRRAGTARGPAKAPLVAEDRAGDPARRGRGQQADRLGAWCS